MRQSSAMVSDRGVHLAQPPIALAKSSVGPWWFTKEMVTRLTTRLQHLGRPFREPLRDLPRFTLFLEILPDLLDLLGRKVSPGPLLDLPALLLFVDPFPDLLHFLERNVPSRGKGLLEQLFQRLHVDIRDHL